MLLKARFEPISYPGHRGHDFADRVVEDCGDTLDRPTMVHRLPCGAVEVTVHPENLEALRDIDPERFGLFLVRVEGKQ